jgi:LPXTG-motif cell wall-anchored protein
LSAPTGLRKGAATDTETTTGVDYIIKEETDGYQVIFTQEYLKTVKAPTTVTITYKAEVTTDAAESVNTEENEVWVEYSHNPKDETDYEFKKDDTNHYTFTIDANVLGGGESAAGRSGSEIVKVGVDASGHPITSTQEAWWDSSSSIWQGPLGGALFTLYEEDGTTVYTSVDGTEYKDIPSLDDGRIILTGLDAGKYVLKETKAPNGFVKDPNDVNIEIRPVYDENKSVTMYTKDGENWVYAADIPAGQEDQYKSATYTMKVLKESHVFVNGSETTHTFYNDGGKSLNWIPHSSKEVPSSIVNTQGVELPSTGGIGTTLFYAGGAVLVLLAGVLLVSKRRIA